MLIIQSDLATEFLTDDEIQELTGSKQLKDIRPFAATERYKQEGIEATRRFLGHSTEAQTRSYIRDYLGEETQSHELTKGKEDDKANQV